MLRPVIRSEDVEVRQMADDSWMVIEGYEYVAGNRCLAWTRDGSAGTVSNGWWRFLPNVLVSKSPRELVSGQLFTFHEGGPLYVYRGGGWYGSPDGYDGGPWYGLDALSTVFAYESPSVTEGCFTTCAGVTGDE